MSTVIKKTGRSVSESCAVQKQREEVVGRLLHFSRRLFVTKNANFPRKVTDVLMYLTIFHFKPGLTQG